MSLWKYVHCLRKTSAKSKRIIFVAGNSILENIDKIAETFNNLFASAVWNFNILSFMNPSVDIDHTEYPISNIIAKYQNHPSVAAIKKMYKQFSFKYIPKSDAKTEILNLDVSKASPDSDIPTKITWTLTYLLKFYIVFNRSLKVGEFPSGMKLVYVTPVHTKCNRYDKSNYGPVRILSNLSKAIERCFYYH